MSKNDEGMSSRWPRRSPRGASRAQRVPILKEHPLEAWKGYRCRSTCTAEHWCCSSRACAAQSGGHQFLVCWWRGARQRRRAQGHTT